jgi:hypothetical protein
MLFYFYFRYLASETKCAPRFPASSAFSYGEVSPAAAKARETTDESFLVESGILSSRAKRGLLMDVETKPVSN